MVDVITKNDSLQLNSRSGLDTNNFHTFPLPPEAGLRSLLWRQILSITEEVSFLNHLDELTKLSSSKLVVLNQP